MIIRIVRMTFAPENVETFLGVFNASKHKIRAVEGCEYLELWRDADHSNVLMTHSHWNRPEDLEAYRHSELFKQTWAKTKPLFSERPQAFSAVSQGIVHPSSSSK